MQSAKEWLIEWFKKHGSVGDAVIAERGTDNYLELGWIDSFTFVAFVSDIETYFNIRLDNDEFQNRAFMTIDGLSYIIDRKLHAKK